MKEIKKIFSRVEGGGWREGNSDFVAQPVTVIFSGYDEKLVTDFAEMIKKDLEGMDKLIRYVKERKKEDEKP